MLHPGAKGAHCTRLATVAQLLHSAAALPRSTPVDQDIFTPCPCPSEVQHGLQDGTQKNQKVFVNIPTEVGATEAEEIGAPCLPGL